MEFRRFVIATLTIAVLSACGPTANVSSAQNSIQVEQARIVVAGSATPISGMDMSNSSTPNAGMDMSTSSLAGYLTIKNAGSSDDQLLSASADFAGMVMLHKTVISNNVASMQEVSSIDIPAGQTISLQPGGLHIMFMNLKSTPQVGTKVPLTLVFQKAGTMTVQADVTGE